MGVLDFSEMHVFWRLMDNCNYDCDYCVAHADTLNCVMLHDRMLAMAWKILDFPADRYQITLTGGEPTLHPVLPELARYLGDSHRDIFLTLETNGSCDSAYYLNLAQKLPPGRLRLAISLHPGKVDLKAALLLVASLSEHDQELSLRIAHDPAQQELTEKFFATLCRLRHAVPFTLQLQALRPTSAMPALNYSVAQENWRETCVELFATAASQGPPLSPSAFAPLVSMECLNPLQCARRDNPGKGWRFASPAVLHIEPDGSFYSAPCALNGTPLWEASDNPLLAGGEALTCNAAICPGADLCLVPSFATLEAARQYAGAAQDRFDNIRLRMPPLRNPSSSTPDIQTEMRFRLLESGLKPDLAFVGHSVLFNLDELAEVYSALADAESKKNFLFAIVALLNDKTLPKHMPTPQITDGETVFFIGCPAKQMTQLAEASQAQIYKIDKYARRGNCAFLAQFLRCQRTFCSRLIVGNVEKKLLAPIKALIYDFLPAIDLAFTGSLDLPLWLIRHFSRYSLRFTVNQNGQFTLQAQPDELLVKKTSILSAWRLSVIIDAIAGADELKRTLDSLLLQKCGELETIIYNTPPRIQALPETYAPLHITGIDSENPALALAVTTGENVLFMRAGDVLFPASLPKVLEAIDKGVEIVRLNTCKDACNVSLADLFADGIPQLTGVVYSRNLLTRSRASFTSVSVLPDILRLFYLAGCIVDLPGSPYAHTARKAGKWTFAQFAETLAAGSEFFAIHDLEIPAVFAETLLYSARADICTEIAKRPEAIDTASLERLGTSATAVQTILREVALAARDMPISVIAATDVDLSVLASPVTWEVVNAGLARQEPVLSVIMPNYNKGKYLKKTLASILEQSFQDFELLIIDDASEDDSRDILRLYAFMYPQIRFYQMRHNVRQGICRNLGLREAAGKYVIFVDSDDLCLPGYFHLAVETMKAGDADLLLFSSERVNTAGENVWQNRLPEARLAPQKALAEFFAGTFEPAPWAKIYRRQFLLQHNITFPEYIYYQDEPFFYKAIKKAAAILCRPNLVYQCVETPDSVLRPRTVTPLHLYSSLRYFEFRQNCLDEWVDNPNVLGQDPYNATRWHLETLFLGKCAAWLRHNGALPLPLLMPLCKCTNFLVVLLRLYADLKIPSAKASLPQQEKPETSLISIVISYDKRLPMSGTLESIEEQSLRPCEIITIWQEEYPVNLVTRGKYACLMSNAITLSADFLLHAAAILESYPETAFVYAGASEARFLEKEEILATFSLGGFATDNPIVIHSEILQQAGSKTELVYKLFLTAAKACVTPGSFSRQDQTPAKSEAQTLLPRVSTILSEFSYLEKLAQAGAYPEAYLAERQRYLAGQFRQGLKRMEKLREPPVASWWEDYLEIITNSKELLMALLPEASGGAARGLRKIAQNPGPDPSLTIALILPHTAEATSAILQKLTASKNPKWELLMLTSSRSEPTWPQCLHLLREKPASGLYVVDPERLPVMEILAQARGKYVVFFMSEASYLDSHDSLESLTRLAAQSENITPDDICKAGNVRFSEKGFWHKAVNSNLLNIIADNLEIIDGEFLKALVRKRLLGERE